MERTIKVTGKATISVRPDVCVVYIGLDAKDKSYDATLSMGVNQVNKVKAALANVGFKNDDVKTLSFSINPYYESYRDKDGNYKNKFIGYKCLQNLKLEFSIDNEVLGHVLGQLSAIDINPNLSIAYTLSNVEEAKRILLSKGVKEANEKANILASAASVALKRIINIDYSYASIRFESERFMMSKAECCSKELNIDINPDDLVLDDNVTITWEIE